MDYISCLNRVIKLTEYYTNLKSLIMAIFITTNTYFANASRSVENVSNCCIPKFAMQAITFLSTFNSNSFPRSSHIFPTEWWNDAFRRYNGYHSCNYVCTNFCFEFAALLLICQTWLLWQINAGLSPEFPKKRKLGLL